MTAYRSQIETAAHFYKIDPDLVEAIVVCESSGQSDAFRHEPGFWKRYLQTLPEYQSANPRRVSSSYGLMQVMFSTAKLYGFIKDPEYLFVPSVNLDFGCQHLAKLLRWADGDVEKACAAYNGGQGNWKADAPQAYAKKVWRTLKEVQKART